MKIVRSSAANYHYKSTNTLFISASGFLSKNLDIEMASRCAFPVLMRVAVPSTVAACVVECYQNGTHWTALTLEAGHSVA
jgi:hypothetical protein